MTKKFLIAILAVLLVFGLASCNGDAGSKGGGGSEPTRPAELSVNSFTENYLVGTANPSGTLLYTSTEGKITPLDINDAGVTTNFDASEVAENKFLRITYKGIDAVKYYNVKELETVDISGTYIVGKNTTLTFKKGSTLVVKEVWSDWDKFFNLPSEYDPEQSEENYTVGISPAGRTVIRVFDWTYTPRDGELATYPSEGSYFEFDNGYTPNTYYFYVSTYKEDNRSTTNESARGRYLIMQFDVYGNANFWFATSLEADVFDYLRNPSTPSEAASKVSEKITIPASEMSFDQAGLNFKDVTVNETNAKNLAIILNRENYASKTRAFGFVSSTGDGYKGYSYTMKLSDEAVF